ncbi:hypothetical protein VTO73DRAFT_1741 [Trametes versicolor]
MDTLPLETLQRIFQLACTDGGRTGNSLSLVSRGIHSAARTTRFHSIALIASPRRLQSFLNLYERECDPRCGDKPRIQHLHVAFPCIELGPVVHVVDGADMFWPLAHSRSLEPAPSPLAQSNLKTLSARAAVAAEDAFEDAAGTSTARALEAAPKRNATRPSIWTRSLLAVRRYRLAALERLTGRHRTGCESEHRPTLPKHPGQTTYETYRDAAQTLIRLVAPDLVTLAVQYGFSYGGQIFLPIVDRPFPRLLEATFVGVVDPRTLLTHPDSEATTPLFPTLTHLYIVPAYAGGTPGQVCLPFWTTHAPGVTHLGVSRAEDFIYDIANAMGLRVPREYPYYLFNGLAQAGDSDSNYPPSPPPTPRYPSVRHLVLQPGRGPIGDLCGNAWIGHDARIQAMRQVCSNCEAIGVEAFQAEAPVDGQFVNYYERARRGWLERIDDNRDQAGGWRG